MKKRTEIITCRVTPEELEHLHRCSSSFINAKFSNGKDNFSEYLRVKLLFESKYKNKNLEEQIKDVKYELRKIGTNVNQIAKKINSGFGTTNDIRELESYLSRIENIFTDFREEVEQIWQSQS